MPPFDPYKYSRCSSRGQVAILKARVKELEARVDELENPKQYYLVWLVPSSKDGKYMAQSGPFKTKAEVERKQRTLSPGRKSQIIVF